MYMALICTVFTAGNLWALIILSASIIVHVWFQKSPMKGGQEKEGRKEDQVSVQFRLSKYAPYFSVTAAGLDRR